MRFLFFCVASFLTGFAPHLADSAFAQSAGQSPTTQPAAPYRVSNFGSIGVASTRPKRVRVRIGRGIAPSLVSATTELRSTTQKISVGANPNNLTFTFAGYSSSANQTTLSTFLRANYERIVELWGEPAPSQRGKNVVIRGDGNEGDAIYFPPASDSATSGGEIFFNYKENFSPQTNNYNLTRVVLNAFWGAHVPSYEFLQGRYVEPWVFGMTDAAAAQIAFQAAGSPADFNPSVLYDDLLPVYDFFNRPELGSATIFSPNGADLVIADFRLSMAQGAFLKMAIEKPTFFADFNRAYYAQTTARVPTTMDRLKSIAASVVPTVEGQSFSSWVRGQYVLDGTVTTGQKLYAGVLPLPNELTGDTRGSVQAYVQAFTTDANGNETPSTGFGSVSATDSTGRDLTAFSRELSASNIVEFNDTRTFPGQGYNFTDFEGRRLLGLGFTPFGASGPTLITLKFKFKDAESLAYFPYGATGSQGAPLTYYGAAPGVSNATLRLNGSSDVSVLSGAFRSDAPYPSGPRVQTEMVVNGRTIRRNTAWLAPGAGVSSSTRGVGFLLDAPPSGASINFAAPGGASSVRMVSFPIFPAQSDEAEMLNLPRETLALGRYRPNLSPAARQGDALVFGIGTDRHELYPNISSPVIPGQGYWLGTGTNGLQRTITGGATPTDKAYEVPLLGGWNQFGPPFNRAFSPASVKVRYAGFAPVSLPVAQSRGWIAPGVWRWLPGGGYARVDTSEGGNFEPFVGYYIFASAARGTSLVFEPTQSNASALKARTGWSLELLASSKNGRDSSSRIGISSDSNVAKPPTGASILTLSLSAPTGDDGLAARTGSGLAEAYAPTLTNGVLWRAQVEGAVKGERVTVSWGNLKGVPLGVVLHLRDMKTGTIQTLLSGGSYSFTSDGTPRVLNLSATSFLVPRPVPSNPWSFSLPDSTVPKFQYTPTLPPFLDMLRRSKGTS